MLAKKIKKYREKNKWSQQKLAEETGLAYTTITKIEQGVATNPRMETLVKIADALQISIDELIGRRKS